MKLVKQEIEILGDASKVFVGGFSQGAVIANGIILNPDCPANLAGVFAQSGLQSLDSAQVQIPKFPILLIHGTDDDHIVHSKAILTYGIYKDLSNVEIFSIPGYKHKQHNESIQKVHEWMNHIIQAKM